MNKEYLEQLKKELQSLTTEEQVKRDLHLRKIASGKIYGPMTGYASIDKPWLKYYQEEYIKAEIPYMTAYDYLKKLNKDNMDLPAIDSEFGNYTYRELIENIDMTANSLYQMGTKKGEIIVTLFGILPHESFVLYGIDKVGGAMAPLPPQVTPNEVIGTINKFNSKLFFAFDYLLTPEMEQEIYDKTNVEHIIDINFTPLMNRDKRTISWSDFISKGLGVELPDIKRDSSDLLFLTGTGGSTGAPKSVMLNDNNFNIIIHQFINSDVNYNVGDKWIRLWPIFSASAAVSNHHLPLCTGGLDLLRNFPVDNIRDFDKIIYYDKPNHNIMIPQLIDVLEQSELLQNEDMSYVKTYGCGGLAITPDFERRCMEFYKKHNINTFLGYGWGCTEHSSSIAMRSNFETTSIGTAGAPMVKTTVAVFEPGTSNELPYGTEGELCINSETIMMGYFGEEELTKEAIKIHPDGTKWLHTKDLGIMDVNGIIKVTGRMSRVIFVYPTAKVYPQNLEGMISKVPGVQEVAIAEIPDLEHEGFFMPVCFIVPTKEADINIVIANIKELCKNNLEEHARPKEIYIKEVMPLTKVGKPDIITLERELKNNLTLTRKAK